MRRAWRGGAPRTSHALPPFHLRFHPLLRSSFGFSFCPLSFSLFTSSYLCYTYFVNETLTPLPLLFLSSRAVQPRPTDISISVFAALSNFTLLHFCAITFRESAPLCTFSPSDSTVANLPSIPSNSSPEQNHSFTFVGLLGEQVITKVVAAPAPSASHSHSENCFFDYPRLPFNPQPIPR